MKLLLALTLAAALDAEVLSIEPAEGSRFLLTVEKTGLWAGRKHQFRFDHYRGKLDYDQAHPEQSRVDIEIDADPVLLDQWLSDKDKRKVLDFARTEMLTADRFPKLAFRSERIEAAGAHRFLVRGQLTVRGITKPAVVTITIIDANSTGLSVEGEAVIGMKDYGLKPPAAALGAIGTRNEMQVTFKLLAKPAR